MPRGFLHWQTADSGAEATLTRSEVESLTADARAFVAEVRAYFERQAPGNPSPDRP
jgi:hypothetical protein